MIKHIKPLPISEEMLGAYLEGNLASHDAKYVELILQSNDELAAFVDELSVSDDMALNYLTEEMPSFENDFVLPEISMGMETSMEPHILPFEFEPLFAEVAAYAVMPDVADDGDIIINNNLPNDDIDNVSDIGIDMNCEDLPIDGE